MATPPRDFREWMRQVERKLQQAIRSGNAGAVKALNIEAEKIRQEVAESSVDNRIPAAPVEFTFQTELRTNRNGMGDGFIHVDFAPVTRATNGTFITIDHYEFWGREETNWDGTGTAPEWKRLTTSGQSQFTHGPVDTDSTWRFRVRAFALTAPLPGEWSQETYVEVGHDTTPPPIPSPLTITAKLGTMTLSWDGLAGNGAAQPADYKNSEVAFGTASSPTTILAQRMEGAGQIILTGLPYNTPHYARIRSVDHTGNKSAWSANSVGEVTPLVSGDISGLDTTLQQQVDRAEAAETAAEAAAADAVAADGRAQQAAADAAAAQGNASSAEQAALDAQAEAAQAQSDAAAANAAAAQAAADAETARLAAANAEADAEQSFQDLQTYMSSSGRVIQSETEPAVEDQSPNNLWIKPSTGETFVWKTDPATGTSSWVEVENTDYAQAAANAAAAQAAAETARDAAAAAEAKAASSATAAADSASSAATLEQQAAASKTAADAAAADALAAQNAATAAEARATEAEAAATGAQAAADQSYADLQTAIGEAAQIVRQEEAPTGDLQRDGVLWIKNSTGESFTWHNVDLVWQLVDNVRISQMAFDADQAADRAEAAEANALAAQGEATTAKNTAATAQTNAEAAQAAAVAAEGRADQAEADALAAQQAATTAQQNALAAEQRADEAEASAAQSLSNLQTYMDTAGRIIRQEDEPTGEARNSNNLWIKDSTGQSFTFNELTQLWEEVENQAYAAAATAADAAADRAEAAEAAALQAEADALAAQNAATAAQGTAADLVAQADAAQAAAEAAQSAATTAQQNAAASEQRAISAENKAISADTKADAAEAKALEAVGIAGSKGVIYAQPEQPADDPAGMWIDTDNGNAVRVMTKKRALYRSEGGGSGSHTRFEAAGWAVTTTTEVLTLAMLEGYDALILDGGYGAISSASRSVATQAWAAGYSLFTTGNDTTYMPPMFTSSGQRGTEQGNDIVPVTGHPIVDGTWENYRDTDLRLYMTGIHADATILATTAVAGVDQPVATALEDATTTARWVHIESYTSNTPVNFTIAAAQWIASRWRFVQDQAVLNAAAAAIAARDAADAAESAAVTAQGEAETAKNTAATSQQNAEAAQAAAVAAEGRADTAEAAASAAQAAAVAAEGRAATAEANAEQAAADANQSFNDLQTFMDKSGRTIYQEAEPAVEDRDVNNLWIKPSDGSSWVWDANLTQWVEVVNEAVKAAALAADQSADAAIAAQSAAEQAEADALTAQNAATAASNKATTLESQAAAAQAAAEAAEARATTAEANAASAAADAEQSFNDLQTTMANSGKIIYQEAEPTGDDRDPNNLWIKDSTGEVFAYSSTQAAWVLVESESIRQMALDADAAADRAEAARLAADNAETAATAAQGNASAAQTAATNARNDATAAQTAAQNAEARATTAEANAANAAADAEQSFNDLQGFLDNAGKIIHQEAEPAVEDRSINNLWIKDSTGEPHVWNPAANAGAGAWEVVTDQRVVQMAADADAAADEARAAEAAALAAQGEATTAKENADAAAQEAAGSKTAADSAAAAANASQAAADAAKADADAAAAAAQASKEAADQAAADAGQSSSEAVLAKQAAETAQAAADASAAEAEKALKSARSYINPGTGLERLKRMQGLDPQIVDSPTAMGGIAIEKPGGVNAHGWWEDRGGLQAIDPDLLYRFSTKVRITTVTTESDVRGDGFYFGAVGFADEGVTHVNRTGDDSYSNQQWVIGNSIVRKDGIWQEYVCYYKGIAADLPTGSGTLDSPRTFHASTKWFAPGFILDYNSGNGIWELSHWAVDAIDSVGHQALLNAATAQTKANDAHELAGDADDTAKAALNAASHAGRNLFSSNDPSGTAPYGTIWIKHDATGKALGNWQQTGGSAPDPVTGLGGEDGSTWTKRPVTSEMIDNLDVSKLTGLYIDAKHIQTSTLTIGGSTLGDKVNTFDDATTKVNTALNADGTVKAEQVYGSLTDSNIPMLPQSKVTGLDTVASNASTAKSKVEAVTDASGNVVASKVSGTLATTNIPTLDQSKVSGLTTDLAAIETDIARVWSSARSYINEFTSADGIASHGGPGPTVIASPTAVAGKALKTNGNAYWIDTNGKQAFDPTALYRLRLRLRAMAGSTGTMYFGVCGWGADGTTYVNSVGANSPSQQHWVHNNVSIPADEVWRDYDIYISGNTTGNSSGGGYDALAPKGLHMDVRFIAPEWIVNWGSGVPPWEISHVTMEVIDANAARALVDSELAAERLDAITTGDGKVLDATKVSGTLAETNVPTLSQAKVSGLDTVASNASTAKQKVDAAIGTDNVVKTTALPIVPEAKIPTLQQSKVSGLDTVASNASTAKQKVEAVTDPTTGKVVATQVTGTLAEGNIPTLQQSKVSGLTGDLSTLTSAAAAAQSAAEQAMAQAVNVVPDPSLEQGKFPLQGQWDIDETVARSGTHSLRQLPVTSGTSYTNMAVGIPVSQDQKWRITAYVMTTADYNGTGSNGKLRTARDGGVLMYADTWPNTAGAWAKVERQLTVPADMKTLDVTLGADHTVGTLWLDDLEITNVTAVLAAQELAEDAKERLDAVTDVDGNVVAGKVAGQLAEGNIPTLQQSKVSGLDTVASNASTAKNKVEAVTDASGNVVAGKVSGELAQGNIPALPIGKLTGEEFDQIKGNAHHSTSIAAGSAGTWFRIAMNIGDRASGRFILKDTTSSQHMTVTFEAGIMYSQRPYLSLSGFTLYGQQSFAKVRMLSKSTFDDVFLDVLVNETSRTQTLEYYLSDNVQVSGWDAVDWEVAPAIPTGYTSKELVLSEGNVIATIAGDAKGKVDYVTDSNGNLEAGKVAGELATGNIPELPQSKVTNLTSDLAVLDTAASAAMLAQATTENPSFEDWSGALPDGYGGWSSGPSKDTAWKRIGSQAMRFTVGAASTQYGVTTQYVMDGLPNSEYFTVEVDFMLLSGTLPGSGVIVDWLGLSNGNRATVNFNSEVPNPSLNKWYRLTKTVRRPTTSTGTWAAMSGYLMANWSSFGGATKDIVYDWFNVRPATSQEIEAYEAKAAIDNVTDSNGNVEAGKVAGELGTGNIPTLPQDKVTGLPGLATDVGDTKGRVDGWTKTGTTFIDGGEIYTDSVKAGAIDVNDFWADTANIGSVKAVHVDSEAIQTQHLALGAVKKENLAFSLDELVPNPKWLDETLNAKWGPHNVYTGNDLTTLDTAGWRWDTNTDNLRFGQTKQLLVDGVLATDGIWQTMPVSDIIETPDDEKYYLSVDTFSGSADFYVTLALFTYDANMVSNQGTGAYFTGVRSEAVVDPDREWVTHEAVVTLPPGTKYFYIGLQKPNTTGAGYVMVGRMNVRKAIAGEGLGRRAELSPAGMKLFNQDGGQVVNLTSEPPQFLGILDGSGNTLAGISEDGAVTGETLNIREDPVFNGIPLFGDTTADKFPGAVTPVGFLDNMPRGIVARGYRPMNIAATATNQEREILELSFDREYGRAYKITVSPWSMYIDGAYGYLKCYYTADGSRPTMNSPRLQTKTVRNNSTDGTMMDMGVTWYDLAETGSGRRRYLFTYEALNGSISVFGNASDGSQFRAWVEDMGRDVHETGLDRNGYRSNGGTAPSAPATDEKKNYTTTWQASSYRSFYTSGGTYTYNTSKMYQGNSSVVGGLRSIACFPSMTGTLSGATINSVEAYFYFNHWYYNNGGTAQIGVHGASSLPSSLPSITHAVTSSSWPKPGGRWVKLPSNLYAGFKSGAYRGVSLGDTSPSTSEYGYANGSSTRIRINYTK